MSRCNSPIPEIIVCPDSSSVRTRNDGSSLASLPSATLIFSWSEIVLGSTATEITGRLQPWLDDEKKGWSLGTTWEYGGEIETSVESNQSIAEKMPVAALIIGLGGGLGFFNVDEEVLHLVDRYPA